MQLSPRSTSTRTFVVWPALVAAEQLARRRRMHPGWLPLLPWGFAQYRWSGTYRTKHGGGGPGMKNPPERVVTSGIYAYTRNPMYLGHQIFLAGLALSTRSPLAALLFVGHIPWFNARAAEDEASLQTLFGEPYERYREAVPRWLSSPARRK